MSELNNNRISTCLTMLLNLSKKIEMIDLSVQNQNRADIFQDRNNYTDKFLTITKIKLWLHQMIS